MFCKSVEQQKKKKEQQLRKMAPSISTFRSHQPRLPNLPYEIIIDILSRLPAKSLLRFKCVSKLWRSTIDSHDFIKIHLNQYAKSSSNRSLILGFLGIYSIDYLDSLDSARVVSLKPPFSSSDVSNSCNGLVLLLGQHQTPFLWNPCTKKYRTLPDSPVESPSGIVVTSSYTRYGFGCVSQDDDYRVLRVVEFRGFDSIWIGSEAKVYSLKSNSWKKVENYPYPLPRVRGWGVHVNGALHTLLILDNFEQEIVAFDLKSEKNYTVQKPDFLLENVELSVDEMAGCLCLLSRKKRRTDIWIMKEYGVKKSWTKLLSIAPPVLEDPCSIVRPLAYSKSGDEVLLNYNDERLVWYDLRTKTTTDVDVKGLPFRFYAEVFVGSLVPLENVCVGVGGGVDGIEIRRGPGRLQKRKVKDNTRKKRDDFLSEGFKLVL